MTRTTQDVVRGMDLTGRCALVTGATSGLGLETARALAAVGARVVLAGRDDDRLERARSSIRDRHTAARLETVVLDLADLASVRAAACEMAGRTDRLDVLVNNAGVMFTPLERTVDGFELQLGTNHLGHFLLTRLLEPLLLAGARARVVVLSSGGHGIADIDLDDPNWRTRAYDKFAAYGAAKTANLLFAVELDRRLAPYGVRANAVHPGAVATDLGRHMDRDDMREMARLAARAEPTSADQAPRRMQFLTVEQGAATSVWAATAPELEGRGALYLADCAVSDDARSYATDPRRAERLWRISEDLVDGSVVG